MTENAVALITDMTEIQQKIAQGLSQGLPYRRIASLAGCSARYVAEQAKNPAVTKLSKLIASGELQERLAELVDFTDASAILKRAAPRAAEKLTELMEEADSEQVQGRMAEAVLDRAGHHKKTEIQQTNIFLDADTLKIIEETRKMREIPEAEYQILEPEEIHDGHDGEEREASSRDDGRGSGERGEGSAGVGEEAG